MKLRVEMDELYLKQLILRELQLQLPHLELNLANVKFEVITKQNYRATAWEEGRFRAVYTYPSTAAIGEIDDPKTE